MMSIVCLDLCSLLSLVLYTVSLDPSQIQVYPENGSTSGVFIAMPKNKKYSFNATIAREVCESLSAHIATRAEVQLANHNGLQTCRYGWVKEQIAVIPRTEKNEKCGQNKVGVITWAASPNTSFDVFCFSLTGIIIIFIINICNNSSIPPSRPHTVHQRSSSSMTISSTVLSSHPFTHTSSLTSSHSKTKDPTHLPPPPRSVFGG
uniref:Link domain-containing protein n=1 Tax=Electrophorus electricus TaxID=8005 RepID=A0A4W4F463_ELEEL